MSSGTPRGKEKRRLTVEWLVTFTAALGLLAFFCSSSVTQSAGNRLYDFLVPAPAQALVSPVVVIEIDDRSIQALGGWPISREVYSTLLNKLVEAPYRPQSIGIDLLFLDPTVHDIKLAQAMRQHRVVLPVEQSVVGSSAVSERLPVEVLRNSSDKLAHINLSLEGDGIVRGIKLVQNGRPHLSLAVAGLTPQQTVGDQLLRRFPISEPHRDFQTFSMSDVLAPGFALEVFHDKHVLLGVTAPSLGDRYPVRYPGYETMAGVHLLAGALTAAVRQTWITVAGPLAVLAVNTVPVFVLMMCLLGLRPFSALAAFLLLGALWITLSALALEHYQVWVDPLPFVWVGLCIYPVWVWRRIEALGTVVRRNAQALYAAADPGRVAQPANGDKGEMVLQHAHLLDHAVNTVAKEVDYLTQVINRMPAAVAVYDAEGALLAANFLWIKMLGETAGTPGTDLDLLAQSLSLTRPELDQRLLSDVTSGLPGELPHGRSVEINRGAIPTFGYVHGSKMSTASRGQLQIVTLTDITELRAYQLQREISLKYLSHDMRTPVVSILAMIRSGTEISQQLGGQVAQQAHALLEMMDDFLLAISAQAPRYDLTDELLHALVSDAIDSVAELAASRRISIVEVSNVESAFVSVNARLIVRAIVNLLVNAIKYSPQQSDIQVEMQSLPGAEGKTVQIRVVNSIDKTPGLTELSSHGLGMNFVETVVNRHGGTFTKMLTDPITAWVEISLPIAPDLLFEADA